jgi:uncharacterized membrane protein
VESLVIEAARQIALAINVIAILVVVGGVLEAVVGLLRAMLNRSATLVAKRALWLDFARWLIAGLTFQLAADIVETAIAPSWDDLGKFAAIAAIRTLLSYFLDRDLDTIDQRQRVDEARAAGGKPGVTPA